MLYAKTNNLITKEQIAFWKNRKTKNLLIYLSQSKDNAFYEFNDLSKG